MVPRSAVADPRSCAQRAGSMGSAPEGTMCVYCNEEEAGYIPDGLLGFTCGTCIDDLLRHGDGFLDRKRMDRYLQSLRAVTGDRRHLFHQLFLDRDPRNGQGYNLAPFLIWTNQWHRPGHWAAVAAHDDDATVQESDDDADSLLWEDRWEQVMAAELGDRPMLAGRRCHSSHPHGPTRPPRPPPPPPRPKHSKNQIGRNSIPLSLGPS